MLNVPQCIPVEQDMICTRASGEMSLTEATVRSNNPAFVVLAGRAGAAHNEGNALVAIALIDAHLQAHRVTPDGGHAADARRTADDLIAAQPANGIAYLKRGLASWYLEDLDQARSDWERAAYLLPRRPEPRDNLAVLDSVQ